MEEDIKILNKLEKVFAELKKDDEEGHSSAYEIQWEDIRAIEHLIARNKELEEENKTLTDEYMIQKHLINADFLKDYIPKSKVRERIEEEQKQCILCDDENSCKECMERCVVEGLQELLEEEEV